MSLDFYFDEDSMNRSLVQALRKRRVDALTARDVGRIECSDESHLAFATEKARVLYRFNISDYCRIHREWLSSGKTHAGIVLAHQLRRYSVGAQLRGLLRIIAHVGRQGMTERIEFLSNWV